MINRSNNPSYFVSSAYAHTIVVISSQELEQFFKKKELHGGLLSYLENYSCLSPPSGSVKINVSAESKSGHKSDTPTEIKELSFRWINKKEIESPPNLPIQTTQLPQPNYFPSIKTKNDVLQFREKFFREKDYFKMPWFEEYRYQCVRSLKRVPFELFGHPTACVLATLSTDPSPLETFEKLKSSLVLPKYIDTTFIIYSYVIVDAENNSENVNNKFLDLKKKYKDHFFTVTLNNSPESSFISLDSFVNKFIWNLVLPAIESILRSHFEEVSKARSGIKHKWDLFRGAKFSTIKNDKDGMLFEPSSLVYKERRLADWCLMLGDFTTAFKTYKSLVDIYHNESAHAYKASALEMAGNCLLMMNKSQSIRQQLWHDAEKLFDESITIYTKMGMRLWLKRSLLTLGYWSQYHFQSKSISCFKKLLNIQNIETIEKSFLSQQSAISFLFLNPPRMRSYALDMKTAGDLFLSINNPMYALSCYLAAYSIYEGKDWQRINDYLNPRILSLAIQLSYEDLARKFSYNLLRANLQPSDQIQSYINQYLDFHVKNSKGPVLSPVPYIEGKALKLSEHSNDKEISKLETRLVESVRPRESFIWFKKIAQQKDFISVSGESITIEFKIRNPLNTVLDLTDVHILCEQEISSEYVREYRLFNKNIKLNPMEYRSLKLKVRPLKESNLTIKGIEFDFFSKLKSYVLIENPLVIKVIEPMPNVAAQFLTLDRNPIDPKKNAFFLGEMKQYILNIKNVGKKPLNSLNLMATHPLFYYSSEFEDKIIKGNWISRIDKDLEPDEEIDIPIWIRPTEKGKISLKFLIYYQPVTANPDMKYRIKHIPFNLVVTNSIVTKMKVYEDHRNINNYILNLNVYNSIKDENTVFKVKTVELLSKNWQLKELLQDIPNSFMEIPTLVSTSIFFSLLRKDEKVEEFTSVHFDDSDKSLIQPIAQKFLQRDIEYENFIKNTESNEGMKVFVEGGVDSEETKEEDNNHFFICGEVMSKEPCYIIGSLINKCWVADTVKSPSDQCPIRVELKYPQNIVNDFTKNTLCIVDVVFDILNCSPNSIITCAFDATNNDLKYIEELGYYWSGKVKYENITLAPNEAKSFIVKACFTEPGYFNLDGYKISIKSSPFNKIKVPLSQNIINIKVDDYL